jgi:hypothetical protein
MTVCPPKPRLCLRVGVAGHRPGGKFPEPAIGVVTTTVGEVLDRIRDAINSAAEKYDEYFDSMCSPFELVIVSSLAEGADRIVAQAGLDRGFLLDVVLPFQRNEYANDFNDKVSKDEYFTLLKRARSVFEIEGTRANEARAYEAAGLIMVGNVDILIAVWDGKEPAGIGGTALIVEKAIGAHVPVVMIEPVDAAKASLLWTADNPLAPSSTKIEDLPRDDDARTKIANVADTLVRPPSADPARKSLRRYLCEPERRLLFLLGSVFPLFLQSLFGKKMRIADLRLKPYLSGARDDWDVFFEPCKTAKTWPLDDRLSPCLQKLLLPAAAFADNLAVFYASRYRGVYVSTFVLAAIAVGFALAGVYLHEPEIKVNWVVAELITIGFVVFLWLRGWLGDWHRRWLEYRRLGEWLRHFRVLSLIGAPGSIGSLVDANLPSSDWTLWYARAMRRCLPVPRVFANESYLRAIRDRVMSEIDGQIRYNTNTAARMKRMENHIHAVGILLLAAICIIGGGFIGQYLYGHDFHGESGKHALEHITFFAALLPAIGAALQAIRVQADFETVAHRSLATVERLELIKDKLMTEELKFAQLSDRIHKAVDAMTTDLNEWHVLFRTRPLALSV